MHTSASLKKKVLSTFDWVAPRRPIPVYSRSHPCASPQRIGRHLKSPFLLLKNAPRQQAQHHGEHAFAWVVPQLPSPSSFLVFPPTPPLSTATAQVTGLAGSVRVNSDVIKPANQTLVSLVTPSSLNTFDDPHQNEKRKRPSTPITSPPNGKGRKKAKTEKATAASINTDPKLALEPDDFKFAQMHANIKLIETLPVMNPETRLLQSRASINKLKAALTIPPMKRSLIRLKRKLEQALPWEEQLIRVIAAGEEQRLLQNRFQLMWESYLQLSAEQRTDGALFKRFVQFFQLNQAEPEIDYKDMCLVCNKPYIVNRVRSTLQCPRCGLMVRYLSIRSNIRMATTRQSQNPTTTPEYKQYTRFIPNLRQYIQSTSTAEHDPVLHEQIRQSFAKNVHMRSRKLKWKTGDVKKQLFKLSLIKSMGSLASKIADSMNGTPKAIMNQIQHDETVKLLRMMQAIFISKQGQTEWTLPNPKVAFNQICKLRRWDNLLRLFPSLTYDSTTMQTELARWDQYVPILFDRERKTNPVTSPVTK